MGFVLVVRLMYSTPDPDQSGHNVLKFKVGD